MQARVIREKERESERERGRWDSGHYDLIFNLYLIFLCFFLRLQFVSLGVVVSSSSFYAVSILINVLVCGYININCNIHIFN